MRGILSVKIKGKKVFRILILFILVIFLIFLLNFIYQNIQENRFKKILQDNDANNYEYMVKNNYSKTLK